ncbi:MAG: hypothetical protein C0464_03595 [Cyanobacteria bacterium DS2.008]|nr:hypothetical protein [Cyanobacteria bacterium DS2.008]
MLDLAASHQMAGIGCLEMADVKRLFGVRDHNINLALLTPRKMIDDVRLKDSQQNFRRSL